MLQMAGEERPTRKSTCRKDTATYIASVEAARHPHDADLEKQEA